MYGFANLVGLKLSDCLMQYSPEVRFITGIVESVSRRITDQSFLVGTTKINAKTGEKSVSADPREAVLIIEATSTKYIYKFASKDGWHEEMARRLDGGKTVIVAPLYQYCEWAYAVLEKEGS